MTPERIAELRRMHDEWMRLVNRAMGNWDARTDSERNDLTAACNRFRMELSDNADELLDLAEASGKIAELLQAGTLSSFDECCEVLFETNKEARELHDLLESLSPNPLPDPNKKGQDLQAIARKFTPAVTAEDEP